MGHRAHRERRGGQWMRTKRENKMIENRKKVQNEDGML